MFVCVLRGSGVHDAGGGGAGAGAAVVVVHAEVVAEFVGDDGGERGDVVVGELQADRGALSIKFIQTSFRGTDRDRTPTPSVSTICVTFPADVSHCRILH